MPVDLGLATLIGAGVSAGSAGLSAISSESVFCASANSACEKRGLTEKGKAMENQNE